MNNQRTRKKDSARLVWDSKPRRAPNPKDIEFQTAEVVIPNPYRDEAQIPMSFRDGLFGEKEIDKQKMNRLIWGDNLLAMQALLAQGYEGKINLIYIDPPFDSKADYSHKMVLTPNPSPAQERGADRRGEDIEFTKEPSVIERLAYKDTWAGGTDSYLDMLYPRLQLMKRLLAEDGSIYVHCDWHVNSYIRILLDEVFGKENFKNEIARQSVFSHSDAQQFGRNHDILLFYTKTENYIWNTQHQEYDETYINSAFRNVEPVTGRRYQLVSMNAAGSGHPKFFCGKMRVPPPGRHWAGAMGKSIEELEKEERIIISKNDVPRVKYYLDEMPGKVCQSIWTDVFDPQSQSYEKSGFDTQKSSSLLERIIKASSNEGDLVADFFAGSGTTLAVAEKLGRCWIGCELGKVGIQVTRARLVEQQAKPFLIENIGNYQREMIYLTGGRIWEMQHLILKLYGATPRDKTSGLGVRYLTPVPSPVQERGIDTGGKVNTSPLPNGRGVGGEVPHPRGIGSEVFSLARKLRKKQTPSEQILWECLRDRRLGGIKFKRQRPIGRFITDFYCHEAGLAIEVDGGVHQEKDQAERDRNRSEIINAYGIDVLRIANSEIENNIEKVLVKIFDKAQSLISTRISSTVETSPLPDGRGVRGEASPLPDGRGAGGEAELVYVGYPDRPITAKKAEELAVQAQKLDGRGYKRLVILGWDYEYNYHQALEARKNALKEKLKVQIESRDIPPDIYDYLKKAKSEEEIEALADKVRFYERPYLRMDKPEIKDVGDGKVQIKLAIKRYVLMDIPVSHTSKTEQETYQTLMKLAKDNFAVLIDYWAIDWDYDGVTFKSQWQAFRGNGKKAKTVPIEAVETLDKKKKRTIAVRVVDIFGNDAGAVLEI